MVKLVDTADCQFAGLTAIRVRIPFPAHLAIFLLHWSDNFINLMVTVRRTGGMPSAERPGSDPGPFFFFSMVLLKADDAGGASLLNYTCCAV